MKAAVMDGVRRPLVVREVPEPECDADGAIVRVAASGLCRSDWHTWVGHWAGQHPLPLIMGHEFAGTVEAVGDRVTGFAPGNRVVVPFNGGCGRCGWCRDGQHQVCDDPYQPGFRTGGGYGELVAVGNAALNLVALPESIDVTAAAGMGCRYMTAFHGLNAVARVAAGDWVAVHGCGGIGLSAVQIATALGAGVIAVDIHGPKLDFARALGAAEVVDASNADPADAIHDITGGGAQVSIDALGVAATCRNSVRSLRKMGRHVQIGVTGPDEGGEIALPIDDIMGRELRILGSHGMRLGEYETVLRMIAAGRLDPGKLVTRRVAIEEAGDVIAAMDSYDTLGVTVIDRF